MHHRGEDDRQQGRDERLGDEVAVQAPQAPIGPQTSRAAVPTASRPANNGNAQLVR